MITKKVRIPIHIEHSRQGIGAYKKMKELHIGDAKFKRTQAARGKYTSEYTLVPLF